jgi:phosphoribosylformylglycinamidine synthase
MAALDNFCWPDPVESATTPDGAYKLGQLVRACEGLAHACRAYLVPLISGKDSMKNDARVAGRIISIRPTLLVSLMGIISDVRKAQTTDIKAVGDLLYIVGETRGELGGTIFERNLGRKLGACPSLRAPAALLTYQKIHRAIVKGMVHSCHDLSDAGLWAAVVESCLGGDCGAVISLDAIPVAPGTAREPERLLFCETPSRFLVSVAAGNKKRWEKAMAGVPIGLLGNAASDNRVNVESAGRRIASHDLTALRAAWKGQEGIVK